MLGVGREVIVDGGRPWSSVVVGGGQCRRSSRGRGMVAMAAIGRWWCWVTKGDWPGRLLGARSIRQSRVGSTGCFAAGRDGMMDGMNCRWGWAGGGGSPVVWAWMVDGGCQGRWPVETRLALEMGTGGGLSVDGRRLWVSQESIWHLRAFACVSIRDARRDPPRSPKFWACNSCPVPVIFSRVQEWL